MPKSPKKHKFNEDIERIVTSHIYNAEYMIAKSAKSADVADFESTIDMLECKRNDKDYEWMSDINIPELASIIHTEASQEAGQYFATRDFVEVELEGMGKYDKEKCRAAKKCINQTLNNREVYHYQKYMRGRLINSLFGEVWKVYWWEKKRRPIITGYEEQTTPLDIDVNGMPMEDEMMQERAMSTVQMPVYGQQVMVDRMNYDVIDPRNVFTDSTYCYSPQQKNWIIIRHEKSYEQLKALETDNGYFNLEFVKEESKSQGGTDTASETYEDNEGDKRIIRKFDVLLRFGKMWSIVKSRDENDNPTEIVPGYTKMGDISDSAELVEVISESVIVGNSQILVRYQPLPFMDRRGNTYRPVTRGLCYIHPTKDSGLSDGKMLKELQTGINDYFNMGADRTKLSAIPTLKGKKDALIDNTTVYFEPEHVIELENPEKDLIEMRFNDDIQGTINMMDMLMKAGQKATSIYPTTMGELPQKASTTATAIAGAEQRTNARANYKSLTYEYTDLQDFYWMILQMTDQFADEETAFKMMGEDSYYFDPDAEYTYSPVTTSIETEYNKYRKLQIIDQFIGRLVNLQNPKVVVILNKLIAMAFELMGKEFFDFKDMLLDEKAGVQPGASPPTNMPAPPTANQTGVPQSGLEQFQRGNFGGIIS